MELEIMSLDLLGATRVTILPLFQVVRSCISTIMSWLATEVGALVYNQWRGLLPLFVIPIAISALFVIYKLIKYISWGD